jgi:flagella basal body P-ring formation protein FlgA
MSGKAYSIGIFVFVLTCSLFCQASVEDQGEGDRIKSPLQVHLPREVAIEGNCFNLGQVCIVRGEASLEAAANEVTLGRMSMPGQQIICDRSLILSRLAASGIDAARVTLTGAETVAVRRQQQVIKGDEFVEMAGSFLKKDSAAGSVCQLNAVRVPKDLVLPLQRGRIEHSMSVVADRSRGRARVRVAVMAEGEPLAVREVVFRIKYSCRRAVAIVDIPAGGVISSENVEIEQAASEHPEPADWSPPFGAVARRRIPANSVIRSHMLGSAARQVLVKRNQTVVIRIESPGLLITAVGKALKEATAGEFIKVRNVDSRRVILARVNEDGTVEPVL